MLLLNRRHSISLRGLHPSRMSNGNEIFVSLSSRPMARQRKEGLRIKEISRGIAIS